jgi:multicomponent Na+:H+ antiporter subunit G
VSALLVLRDVALALAVVVALASSMGVLLMRTPYDRLHYVGAASLLCPPLVAIAITLENGLSQASIKAILVALILMLTSPVLAHATLRAGVVRERQSLDVPTSDAEQSS